jgi:translocation and assembly module TamB
MRRSWLLQSNAPKPREAASPGSIGTLPTFGCSVFITLSILLSSNIMAIASTIMKRALFLTACFIGLGLALVGILTHTEVGRDSLKGEIERQFGRAFDGDIEIGAMRGNLLQDVFATDVQLRDRQGRTVASIDSVVYKPYWRSILDRSLSSGRIHLYRPVITVSFDSAGPNLAAIFAGDRESAGARGGWRFETADLRIIDGRLVTVNSGYKSEFVDRGLVFDFTRSEWVDLNGRLRVDARPEDVTVVLRGLTGEAVTPSLSSISLAGLIRLQGRELTMSDFTIESDAARLSADVRYGFSPERQPHFALDLDDADLGGDGLAKLFPVLPFGDRAVVTAHLRGPLDALVIDHFEATRGESVFRGAGVVNGLPHHADFQLAIDRSHIQYADARAVLPTADLDVLQRLGSVDLSLSADGNILLSGRDTMRSWQATGYVAASGRFGQVESRYALVTDRAGLAIDADVDVVSLRPGFVVDGWAQSSLTGSARMKLAGETVSALDGTFALSLSGSSIEGRKVDSLVANIDMLGGVASGDVSLLADGGRASVSGSYDRKARAFDGDLRLRAFDVNPWLLTGETTTSLNADVRLAGSGSSLNSLNGRFDVRFDESAVIHPSDQIIVPPHVMRGELTQDANGLAVRVAGDVFEASVGSESSLADLIAGILDWQPALDHALAIERSKIRNGWNDSLVTAAPIISPRPLNVRAEGTLLRPEWAATIVPELQGLKTDLRFELALVSDVSGARAELSASGDSLVYRGIAVSGFEIASNLRIAPDVAWPHGLSLLAYVSADSFSTAGEIVHTPRLTASFEDGAGGIHVSSRHLNDAEQFGLAARLSIGNQFNRIVLDRLGLSTESAEWALTSSQGLLLYSDALVVPRLEVASRSARSGSLQRLRIEGALSSAPADTLYAHLDRVRLGDLGDLVGSRLPIAGIVNGRVAMAGLLTSPELTGSVSVDRLIYDGRPLGSLSVESRYVPGQPDVYLDARLSPVDEEFGAIPAQGIPAGAAFNDLRLNGTFRLPTPGPDRLHRETGTLNLRLQARSVDAFFFEHIFRNEIADAAGTLSGSGTIRGDFRKPLFDAQFSLANGSVRVPAFNLAYRIEGNATVDTEGIRLHGVEVRDATGGLAVVDGGILFNEYRYFSLDLRGRLQNSQFMNVVASRDMTFYGDVRATGTVTLTGPLSQAILQAHDATISPESRIFIAIHDETVTSDPGYIIFADADGSIPDLRTRTIRENLLRRPEGERLFVDGLEMDLSMAAAEGVTVHLVVDPVMGDVINATGNGRIQLQRIEGDYYTFGTFNVNSGDYLFTAGDVFVRRFYIDGGSITWDGQPNNASMDITASYRTRASPAGLNLPINSRTRIPLIVQLHIRDRVAAPVVDLRLLVDSSDRDAITRYESIEALLNQPDRSAEFATSVMLTNSFLLTTSLGAPGDGSLTSTRNQLAFTSLSQLVSSQLNRYLNYALPNLDVSVGLQGESTQDLDVTYGVALSLLDERLVIRGQGLYQNEAAQNTQQNLLDEFVVEVRLSNSVSVEVFYRREGDILGADQTLANTTGAGLSYETQFSTWSRLVDRLFGWMRRDSDEEADVLAAGDMQQSPD